MPTEDPRPPAAESHGLKGSLPVADSAAGTHLENLHDRAVAASRQRRTDTRDHPRSTRHRRRSRRHEAGSCCSCPAANRSGSPADNDVVLAQLIGAVTPPPSATQLGDMLAQTHDDFDVAMTTLPGAGVPSLAIATARLHLYAAHNRNDALTPAPQRGPSQGSPARSNSCWSRGRRRWVSRSREIRSSTSAALPVLAASWRISLSWRAAIR